MSGAEMNRAVMRMFDVDLIQLVCERKGVSCEVAEVMIALSMEWQGTREELVAIAKVLAG